MKTRLIHILLAFMSAVAIELHAQEANNSCLLFKLNRSRDADFICYNLKLKQGKPDFSNPLSAYWVKHDNTIHTEPLTWVQNKYAYGVKIASLNSDLVFSDSLCFQFVSFDAKVFTVKRNNNNGYKAYTKIEDKEVEVESINVHFVEGTNWSADIAKVELRGLERESGALLVENIYHK